MTPSIRPIACCLLLCGTAALAAEDQTPTIDDLLARPIIGADQSLEDVQAFIEPRIARMPNIADQRQWENQAEAIRRKMMEEVVFRGEAAAWREAKTKIEWLDEIEGGKEHRIRKLRYEALPGLWIPALLYEPRELKGKAPVVLNVNGHDRQHGKAARYKQIRCINQVKRGMLALNVEWLGMGQLNTPGFGHYRMNQLNLCGASGLAPYYLAMSRALDLLLEHPHADGDRVAVTGLSGGGWQTIFISSLDTRVTLANPVAGYSSFLTRVRHFSDLGDSEQTPCDMAKVADYTHLTAMLAPRPALLTYNAKDNCCFAAGHALEPLLQAALPVYQLYDRGDRLRSHVNHDPGDHNFGKDNRQALYRMFRDYFSADGSQLPANEIECEDQIKDAAELNVELPEDNLDFNALARELMNSLPCERSLPATKEQAEAWQSDRRGELRKTIVAKDYQVAARKREVESLENAEVTFWDLRIGDTWSVPAVEFAPHDGDGQSVAVVLADEGRKTVADEVKKLLDRGDRVLAIDPFYVGESKIAKRDFLFALLVSSVGERPLGIQASQLTAVARWLRDDRNLEKGKLIAKGPRTSLMALTASALAPQSIRSVQLAESYGTLKQVIEQNLGVNQAPELFCFGLLKEFDMLQLAALTAPRDVTFIQPDERVVKELSPLEQWHALWGRKWTVEN